MVNIAAGRDHAVAITYQNLNNGEGYTSYAFAWGASRSGQLGNGSVAAEGVNAPVLVRDNNDKPISGVVSVAAGGKHTIIRKGGLVYTMGSNLAGQLGDGVTEYTSRSMVLQGEAATGYDVNGTALLNGAVLVAAGGDRSYVMTSEGKVLAFGNNTQGRLGLGFGGTEEKTQYGLVPRLTGSKQAETVQVSHTGVGGAEIRYEGYNRFI